MTIRRRIAALLYSSERVYARVIGQPNWFVRRQFNRWARWNLGPQMEQDHGYLTEIVLERMDAVAGDRVLDLGCGSGWAARRVAVRLSGSGRVVGVDLSDEMIRIAQAQTPAYSNLQFVTASAEELPFSPESFDKIFSVETFYFCRDQQAVLRELLRVAAPRGKLFLLMCLHQENPASLAWPKEIKLPVHVRDVPAYKSMLEAEGWMDVKAELLVPPDRTGVVPCGHEKALLLEARKP